MAGAKFRKGDRVVVLAGKDKGKTGEVIRPIPKDMKVVVSGVNVHARHRKPTQQSPQGGIERKEAPLHVSNVAIADPKTGAPTRVRFEERDGDIRGRRKPVRQRAPSRPGPDDEEVVGGAGGQPGCPLVNRLSGCTRL